MSERDRALYHKPITDLNHLTDAQLESYTQTWAPTDLVEIVGRKLIIVPYDDPT